MIDSINNYDICVLSSHKSATSTVARSIEKSTDLKVYSEHAYMSLQQKLSIPATQTLQETCRLYYLHNNKRLDIICVHRNPQERMISSFFQYNHTRSVQRDGVDPNDTIIMQSTIDELKKLFNNYLTASKHNRDTIDVLSEHLDIDLQTIPFVDNDLYHTIYHQYVTLHLIRFETLITNLETILSQIVRTPVKQADENLAINKAYFKKYSLFKQHFKYNDEQIAQLNKGASMTKAFFDRVK